MKTVRQILDSKGNAVHTIAPDAQVYQALQEMADRDVGALVVVKDDEVKGIVSERDYARKVILRGKFSKDIPVHEVMTDKVVCVDPDQTVEACMALMTEMRVRHLPVLENGRLAGLISIGDVVRAVIDDQKFKIDELEHYITGTPRWG